MNEYKKPSGVPWRLWAALLVVALLALAAYRFFPPRFQLSPVQLVFHGESCTAEFDVTNHSPTPTAKTVRVTVFAFRPGTKTTRPLYVPLDHRDISVALAASETRHFQCEFLRDGSNFPNQAEVEIVSDAQSIPK